MLSGEIHCRIEAGLLDVAEGRELEGQVTLSNLLQYAENV
jgi:hypothetical protein